MLRKRINNAVLIIILFITSVLYSQTDYKLYHTYITKADYAVSNDSAIYYYKKAFKAAQPFEENLRTLCYRYFVNGDINNAKKYFFEAVKAGYQLEKDPDCDVNDFYIDYNQTYINLDSTTKYGLFTKSIYTGYTKKLKELRKDYLKQIDISQDKIYETALQNENYFQLTRSYSYDNKVSDTVFKNISKYAATPNSYYMLGLLKIGKFPERRKCSRFNSQTITMLLNHGVSGFLKKEDASEFIDLLWKQVEKGNLTPHEYASAYDHYVHWFIDKSKTVFGTKSYSDENNKLTLVDLLYPKEVNTLRKQHWLPTIEMFAKIYQFNLPKNYE
jgi:hypothetical protein